MVPAFVIIPTFASSITSDPNAATIVASINRTIAAYESTFTDNITVRITFQEGSSGLGSSSTAGYIEPYSGYRNQLISHATTSDDSTALLYVSADNPITGTLDTQVRVVSALANALGLDSGLNPDSTVTLNTSVLNLDRSGPQDAAKYDLMAVTAHEIDEALSRGSGLDGLANGASISNTRITPADLFRYETAGVHSYNTEATSQAFFSIDGGNTTLARFNQSASGDFGDWYSLGGQTPQVQDAFATRGARPALNVELRRLDVIGYTRVAPVALSLTPPTLQNFTTGVSTSFNLGSIANGNGPFAVTVNWGDNSANTTTYVNDIGSLGTQNHTYASAGNFTPTISVTDFTSQTGATNFSAVAIKVNVAIAAGSVIATGTAGNDPITLAISGSNYRFTDPNGLIAGPGATQTDSTTVDVPMSSVTGIAQIDGGAGNDTLTINSSTGDPFPSGGIAFEGGGQSGDKLIVAGGTYTTITNNYSSAAPGYSGSIVFAGSQTYTLNYDGVLSPIDMTGNTATNLGFNLPPTASIAFLEDDGIAGNGVSQLRSINGTFDATTFANPTGSLTINRGNEADTLTINALPDFTASLASGSAASPLSTVTIAGAITLASHKSVALYSQGTISLPNSASDIATSGTGPVMLSSERNISLATGSSISVVDGNLTLSANQQATASSGIFDAISLRGAALTTNGSGTIQLSGRGGNDPNAGSQQGIVIANSQIQSTASGATAGEIIILGTGVAGTTDTDGVIIDAIGQAPSSIVSVSGNIQITGTAGQGTTTFNRGVAVLAGSQIRSTGVGAIAAMISILGTGSSGTDFNHGVDLGDNILISAVDGRIDVQGTASTLTTGQFNDGIRLRGGSRVESTSTSVSSGGIALMGTGGKGTTTNQGVRLEDAGTVVVSAGGGISITGNAVATTGTFADGVRMVGGATVQTSGTANLVIDGSAAAATTAIGAALRLGATSPSILVLDGPTTTLRGDRMVFDTANVQINAAQRQVTLLPHTSGLAIDVGSTTDTAAGKLELSDAELDVITAGTVQVGNSNSGAVTVSADITRAASTNINLASGDAISLTNGLINTGGGNLLLSPGGAASFSAAKTGRDVTLGSTGTLTFAPGSDVAFAINGTTADTQYDQLDVAGRVDLTGVDLKLTGSYAVPTSPSGSYARFVIINNDGADPVTGTFNGLPEGKMFTTSGNKTFQISYLGGDGNDVVVTAVSFGSTFFGTPGDDTFLLTANKDGGIDISLNGTLIWTNTSAVQLHFHGLEGNDALVFDFEGGNPFGANCEYNDNDIGDSVVYRGASFTSFISRFTPSPLAPRKGYVQYFASDGMGATAGLLFYDGIGSMDLSDNDIGELDLLGSGGSVFVEDDGTIGNGVSQVRSDQNTIATTFFSNRTEKLSVRVGSPNTINDLPDYAEELSIGATTSRPNAVTLAGAAQLAPGKSFAVFAGSFNVTASGNLTVSGGGGIRISADDVDISPAATLNASAGTASIYPWLAGRPVDVGEENVDHLSLTDMELDRVAAATLQIGDANSGDVTISEATTRESMTDISLVSAGEINFLSGSVNTAGGNLTLTPGDSSRVRFAKIGNDVTVGDSGTLAFAAGSHLAIALNGATVDTQYDQLNVNGKVSLDNVTLDIALGFKPALGTAFTIVNNDSTQAPGFFSGLPEGTVFSVTAGTFASTFQISYIGGDGNDVVLKALDGDAVNVAPTFVAGSDQQATDESGPQTVLGWATAISPGPPTDAGQQVLFVVQNISNPALFAAAPHIDADGTLTFTPAPNAHGSADVTLVLMDNGGTANGGSDTSAPQTFSIKIEKLHAWHNVLHAFDVTGPAGEADQLVTAGDALAIINYLNAFGPGPIPTNAQPGTPYLDTVGGAGNSGDDFIAAADALAVINFINAFGTGHAGPAGEGEDARANQPAANGVTSDLFTLLALDIAEQGVNRRRLC